MDKLICPHGKEIRVELENGVVVYKHKVTDGYCSHLNVFSVTPDDVIDRRVIHLLQFYLLYSIHLQTQDNQHKTTTKLCSKVGKLLF